MRSKSSDFTTSSPSSSSSAAAAATTTGTSSGGPPNCSEEAEENDFTTSSQVAEGSSEVSKIDTIFLLLKMICFYWVLNGNYFHFSEYISLHLQRSGYFEEPSTTHGPTGKSILEEEES